MSEPIKFRPIFKDKIWGGEKIKTVLGKDYSPLPNCGETWEVSGVEGNISVVDGGRLDGRSLKDLIEEQGEKLLGKKVWDRFGAEFPLLIKFIDANDDLSIQVHPDDKLAALRHNSKGKTEMWYVVDSEPGAWLYNGFSQQIDGEEYEKRVRENTITDVLKREEVSPGDVYFIPAGRVHSIGKGMLIAEIQQTSDITYRIYDFDRRDSEGNSRELHTVESKDAIDYTVREENRTPYQPVTDSSVRIVSCPYFETKLIDLKGECEINLSDRDSFSVLIAVNGNAILQYEGAEYSLNMGEVILVPAEIEGIKLFTPEFCRVLETFIP